MESIRKQLLTIQVKWRRGLLMLKELTLNFPLFFLNKQLILTWLTSNNWIEIFVILFTCLGASLKMRSPCDKAHSFNLWSKESYIGIMGNFVLNNPLAIAITCQMTLFVYCLTLRLRWYMKCRFAYLYICSNHNTSCMISFVSKCDSMYVNKLMRIARSYVLLN